MCSWRIFLRLVPNIKYFFNLINRSKNTNDIRLIKQFGRLEFYWMYGRMRAKIRNEAVVWLEAI
ncbi:hypothetical protein VIBNIAM115_790003 [Vibrio nigripulchritudo AM115]|nr:hypothetical protein VIBNIAM115_790003 [Vibrio nigripulchritudo AM115]